MIKIKPGQVWIEKKKGSLIRVGKKADRGYWHCETTESGGNHSMSEGLIKKRYRPLTPHEKQEMAVCSDTFITTNPVKVYSYDIGLRMPRSPRFYVPKWLYKWVLDLVTEPYRIE